MQMNKMKMDVKKEHTKLNLSLTILRKEQD